MAIIPLLHLQKYPTKHSDDRSKFTSLLQLHVIETFHLPSPLAFFLLIFPYASITLALALLAVPLCAF